MTAFPLTTNDSGDVATARPVAPMIGIPEPTAEDLRQPYGAVRSRPTAMDLSPDGTELAVLTYKDAYLFRREPDASWAQALGRGPAVVELPLPETCPGLAQREAICFSTDGEALLVTSEGRHSGIFRLQRRPVQ